MISISRLLCGTESPGDSLRYGGRSETRAPVVVWNCTDRCNLSCLHCYASANDGGEKQEMDTDSAKAFVHDLAAAAVPVILFSGGEPLLRQDLFDIARLAVRNGIRVALSTNGTLITRDVAQRLKEEGFVEVGISIDGTEVEHDRFRGTPGAYEAALEGIRHCIKAGLRVSLRFTITRANYTAIPSMFEVTETEGIQRLCFYHMVYAGRAVNLKSEDLDHAQTRQVVDTICEHTLDLYRRGLRKEVLTVANHADGVYLYLKAMEIMPERAPAIHSLLQTNGGNNSGVLIAAVDALGNVHPDQFWRDYSPGNVLERSFAEIWAGEPDSLLQNLKDRRAHLKGRCAHCIHLSLCNGNMRQRAEAVYGDIWEEDPACYLSNGEISLTPERTVDP